MSRKRYIVDWTEAEVQQLETIWRFLSTDARCRLEHLYPKLEQGNQAS